MKRVPIFCLALASVCGASGATVAPFASYGDGMLSHITPRGWLERALRTQSAGLTGHPEALSYPYNTCLWAGRIPRAGETATAEIPLKGDTPPAFFKATIE